MIEKSTFFRHNIAGMTPDDANCTPFVPRSPNASVVAKVDKYALPEPPKPWADYPLHWFRNRYRKKFQGTYHYFTADPIASYDAWKEIERKANLGERVATATRRYTLEDAKNVFLSRQRKRLDDGQISESQFCRYRNELKRLGEVVTMKTKLSRFADQATAPDLFHTVRSAAMKRGLQIADKHIAYVRAMFDYAASPKGGLLMPPPFYGDDFDKPTGTQIQKERNASRQFGSDPMWTFDEARTILKAAKDHDSHLYAQLVLAAVAGYTSADLAALPLHAIDRRAGIINFPRAKNGRQRLCMLIPEILVPLEISLKNRPEPADPKYAHLVFLTARGTPICRVTTHHDEEGRPKKVTRLDSMGQNLKRLIKNLDLETTRAAMKRDPNERPVLLGREKLGQSSFRSMNYSAGITAGVDKDYLAVLRGRQFSEKKIEEYYLRGDLRVGLEKLVRHIAGQFGLDATPYKFVRGQRGRDASRRTARPSPSRRGTRSDSSSPAAKAPAPSARRAR